MNETLIRAASGALYVLLLVFCTLFSPYTFHSLFTILMIFAITEFGRIAKIKNIFIPIVFSTLISLGVFFLKPHPLYFLYASIGVVMFMIVLSLDVFAGRLLLRHKWYSNILMYVILPFILLMALPYIQPQKPLYQLIVCVFIMIWCNDTFAYVFGKSFGKNKLLERVSPKKTIEGFLGGMLFTLIGSYLLSLYFHFFPLTLWLLTGLFISIFGTIGDLVESKFKREANIKDSGTLIPGHGGVLDRLDSVIFVIPFLFLFYIIYFNYA